MKAQTTDSLFSVSPIDPDTQVNEVVTMDTLRETDTLVDQRSSTLQPAVTIPKKVAEPDGFQFTSELIEGPQDTLHRMDTSTANVVSEQSSSPSPYSFSMLSNRPQNAFMWEIAVLILAVLAVASMKAFRQRRFELLLKAFINSRWVPQNLREENTFTNQTILLLNVSFAFILSLFIYHAIQTWMPALSIDPLPFFLKTSVLIFLIYITKFSVLEVLAEIIDQRPAIREYIFNVMIFNLCIGIGLLPFLLGNAMTIQGEKMLLTSAILLLALIYLYRNWRAVKISITYRFPVYYIFLYLCTLEILPSIVLIKLISAQLI